MSSTPEAILEGMSRAWRKARRRTAAGEFSGHQVAAEDPRRFKGGSKKNFFNNRGLITGAAGKGILLENFGVARWVIPVKRAELSSQAVAGSLMPSGSRNQKRSTSTVGQ